MIYIIGSGGVGSALAPTLCMLVGPSNITVIDGDTLEQKNLNRQLFRKDQVGDNKAEALAQLYGCEAIPKWYSDTMMPHKQDDWLIAAVDNNPARMAVLRAADRAGCGALMGANEVHSSEALVYFPEWMESERLDPRKYYPEMSEDLSGDPRAAAIGCTGEAQENNRQLVTANTMAAALVAHLYVVWAQEAPKMDKEAHQFLPFKLVNNLSRNEYFRVGEK